MSTIGIDLGTTSMKICIAKNKNLLLERSIYHNANIEGHLGIQNASKILEASENLLKTTWLDFKTTHPGEKCKSLRIAGQMHGIVMWNGGKLKKGEIDCSNLYTWMYPNSPEKTEKLPVPSRPVYPGFGGLTLLELGPDYGNWNRCGTIMDLLACWICKVETVEMSWQLAESWGYCSDSRWDQCLIEATKGKMNLPRIIEDDQYVIGSMELDDFEVPVLISIGDLQGSIRSVEDGNDDAAYLIIGTSSQICMVSKKTTVIPTVDRLPYSLDRCILAGRSMNGGNAVDGFLEMVNGWITTLHPSDSSVNKIDMEGLMNAVDEEVEDSMVRVQPTFIQERGFPIQGATISGLDRSTGIVQVLQSLCSGVIDNLVTLFPLSSMYSLGIRRLFLVGKAKKPRFSRIIRQLCEEIGIEAIDAVNDTSAAYGAAVF